MLIVLLYIGLFARFGFVLPEHSIWMTLTGIGGLGLGAVLWWFLITTLVSKLSRWFNVRGIGIMNKLVGAVIMLVSIVGLVMVFMNR